MRAYSSKTVDGLAGGSMCLLRFAATPEMIRRGVYKVEMHGWEVVEADRMPVARHYVMMDTMQLLKLAAAALLWAGYKKFARTVESLGARRIT
jgi:hypothetical protein